MGEETFSVSSYTAARREHHVEERRDVTREAEQRAKETKKLHEIVDPGVNPTRYSKIRLNPHKGKFVVTVGCPMDIEVTCDTTGSMGGEVDTEMETLPNLYESIAQVLPGYDPQLCLGIFGDVDDDFAMCRPQFEMEASKIVKYLKEMAPQRAGGDTPEDPQYSMFARAYLTNAYTNRIGLKGYYFIVTDATCHEHISIREIKRIFGKNVLDEDLKKMKETPSLEKVVRDLKKVTHPFVILVDPRPRASTIAFWEELIGKKSVITIDTTEELPAVISAIIGLTEGTLDVSEIKTYLKDKVELEDTIKDVSRIKVGAQAALRHKLPHPVPQKGDLFASKEDLWPIQLDGEPEAAADDESSDSGLL